MQTKILLTLRKDKANNYIKMLRHFGILPVFNPETESDALLLCGGGDISPCLYHSYTTSHENVDHKRDYYEMFLIKKFLSENKPIFGICKGMQMLNIFFGGNLISDLKNKEIHYSNSGSDNTHPVFISQKSFLHNDLKKISFVNSYHHQGIKTVNNRLIATLYSNDLCVEALEGKHDKIFATQFHPERMTKNYGYLGYKLFGSFLKCFSLVN